MKKNFGTILAIMLGASSLLLTIAFHAGWVEAKPFTQDRYGTPFIVNYQGQIWEGEVPFDGTGYFKFAVVDPLGTIFYWSNDGTTDPEEGAPHEFITLPVSNGYFSVNLGDNNLGFIDLNADAFAEPETYLRVWFSPDGSDPFTQMPDQVIAAVPYALQAQNAELAETALMANEAVHSSFSTSADLLDGHDSAEFQLRVAGVCPPGQAIGGIGEDGTVICNAPPTHTLRTLGAGHELVDAMVDIVEGSDGLAVIAYYNATSGDLNVFHCNDRNCNSGTNQIVDSTGNVGMYPSIAIETHNFYPLISYYDYTNGDLKVAHCHNVDCSSRTISVPDPTGDVGYDTSITIGGDGWGLISYYNLTNQNLKVAHCDNTDCSSFTITALDQTGDVGSGSSITTNTNGLGLISYYDYTNDNVKLAYCANAACTSTTNMGTVASGGGYGGTSLAIGSDGFPLVIYKDSLTFDLWVVHCTDALCIGSLKSKLDTLSIFDQPMSFSLVMGRDGLGMISYYDTVNGDLKVTHCSNAHCNNYLTFALDMQGNVGKYNAIAIGEDNLPIIAYIDADNVLKVAHCSNELCLPIHWEH